MNKENGYTLLGYIPKKKLNKVKRNIVIVFIAILVVVSLLYSLKVLNENGPKKGKQNYSSPKEITINSFKPVIKNKTNGPITINRELDDGTKVNLFEKIVNNPDNKLENFLYDKETLDSLPLTIEQEERYLCEVSFGLTEDSNDSYEITCPMYYSITIDKAFYGRYARDAERCTTDFKGDEVGEGLLSPLTNCGKNVEKTVKEICEGKSRCDIAPGKQIFQDTCSGKIKYLHLKYHCTKNKEHKNPKFAIVMYANSIKPNSLYENAISEFYQYSKIHGYKFKFTSKKYDTGRNLFYMKLHVIIEAIIEGLKTNEYDWVFWVDGDTVLTNPNIKLETFLPLDNKIHYIAAADRHGLNAGVFLIRVCSWSLNFMMRSVAYHFYNKKLKVGFADQTSMNNVLVTDKEDQHYVIVPQQWFNVYTNSKKPGNFIIHFAGRKEKGRESKEHREKLYANNDWINAVSNKKLRKEVLDYYSLPRAQQNKTYFYND